LNKLITYAKEKIFWLISLLFIGILVTSILTEEYKLLTIPFVLLLAIPVIGYSFRSAYLIFWLLLFTIPLSTEMNFTPSLGTDFPDELLMLILTGIFLLAIIVQPKLIDEKIFNHVLILALQAHLIWILVSTGLSQKPGLSVKFLLAKTWYVIPFVLLPQLFLRNKRSFFILGLCLLIPMSFVMLQSMVRHFFSGFSFESINSTLSPFFRNHVNYGALIVCLFPIILLFYKKASTAKQKTLLAFTIVFFLVALFLTYSRGAWLCLFTGTAGYYILKNKWVNKVMITAVVIVSLAIAWLSYNNNYYKLAPDYTHTYFHSDFSDHILATYTMKDISNAERIYRWVAGFRMLDEHPITGFGPNTFFYFYKNYALPDFKTYVSNNEEHSTVHNYFLLTLIEQGFPGLIIFIALVWFVFLTAQKIYHENKDEDIRTIAITTGIIFTMLITLNMLSDLVETDKLGTLFFLCIGVLIRLDIMKPEEA
jgi:O-antigen ligase